MMYSSLMNSESSRRPQGIILLDNCMVALLYSIKGTCMHLTERKSVNNTLFARFLRGVKASLSVKCRQEGKEFISSNTMTSQQRLLLQGDHLFPCFLKKLSPLQRIHKILCLLDIYS